MRTQTSGHGLHNVPAEMTSFVGRRRELGEIKRRLGSARLLTLTGFGGVGKTRLAIRSASQIARAFRDGAWLVELAPIEDPPLVTQAILNSLGLQDSSAGWTVSRLTDYLADKHLLLIFDNCEHLLDACAVLIEAILQSCPDVRVLATSREPLRLAGEARLRVPPLSLPAVGNAVSAKTLIESEAVVLFESRAVAVEPDFCVDETNAAAVAAVCRGLDGLPLALELAAARLDTMSLTQLVERLGDALNGLENENRGAVPRHRTIEATVDWSYRLLNDAERLLWARLSVFAGAFDVSAAVSVGSDERLPPQTIAEAIGRLVAKSIVRRDIVSGRDLYRLPETLRQFGRDRLRESGAESILRRRHRDWILNLAGAAAVPDDRQALALDQVADNLDNVWSAIDFCLSAPGEAGAGLQICADLGAYWMIRGPMSDARRLLGALLQVTDETAPARWSGTFVAGMLAVAQGELAIARSLLENSLEGAFVTGDTRVAGWSLTYLALTASAEGKVTKGLQEFRDAIRLGRLTANPVLVGVSMAMLLTLASHGPEEERSRLLTEAEQSLQELASLGELWVCSYLSSQLAQLHRVAANLDVARELGRQSLTIKVQLKDGPGIALALETMAWTAASAGEMRQAALLIGAASTLWRTARFTRFELYREDHEAAVAAARRGLGDARYDAEFARGAAMPPEEAVSHALGQALKAPGKGLRSAVTTSSMPLSKREQEIAFLVADGLTNKQIGVKLVISERTVETHIFNILNKLGFNTRTQIASWASVRQPFALA